VTTRHLEAVEWRTDRPHDPGVWPFTVPVVRQLAEQRRLEIATGVTVVVGENGSGKSTLVEALAAVYPRSGAESPYVDLVGPTGSSEDSPLRWHLRARTHRMASPAGFFLRAEAMHAWFQSIDADERQRRAWGGIRLNERSHGESFLEVLRQRFTDVGVYFLDEPESALSFQSCLALLALLDAMRREGSQVIVATHSPVIASLPGATLLEVGDWGLREASYDDLELVRSWRGYLEDPAAYRRHLFDADDAET
jgi:predicted ATPase